MTRKTTRPTYNISFSGTSPVNTPWDPRYDLDHAAAPGIVPIPGSAGRLQVAPDHPARGPSSSPIRSSPLSRSHRERQMRDRHWTESIQAARHCATHCAANNGPGICAHVHNQHDSAALIDSIPLKMAITAQAPSSFFLFFSERLLLELPIRVES